MTRCFSFATMSVSSACLKSKSVFGNKAFTAGCTPIHIALTGKGCGSPSMMAGFWPLIFSMYSASVTAASRVREGASLKTMIGAGGVSLATRTRSAAWSTAI